MAAATAYNVATGKLAVASVTCGPGVTQLMTALPAAVRARLPLVVSRCESPINAKFSNQYIDQAPLVTATRAHYIAAHSVPRMMDYVPKPSTSPSTSGARWCWEFPTTCKRSSTWPTSPTKPRRCGAGRRSGACSPIPGSWPRPSSA